MSKWIEIKVLINIWVRIDNEINPNIPEIIELDTSHDRQRRSSSTSSQDIESFPRPITSSNKRKKTRSNDEDHDDKEVLSRTTIQNDAEVCPICLEEWTNSGQHRLVATECGHLFGKVFV
jgi:hypothetical protein